MPAKAKAAAAAGVDVGRVAVTAGTQTQSLSAALTKDSIFAEFHMWLIGDTPLITHAWSHKAKEEMLSKQVKATRGGRAERQAAPRLHFDVDDFLDHQCSDDLHDGRAGQHFLPQRVFEQHHDILGIHLKEHDEDEDGQGDQCRAT